MSHKIITPPSPVIGTEEAKLALRIDSATEDALIDANILTAMAWAQHQTGVAMGEQVVEIALDGFPSGAIELELSPVTSIVSVTYADTSGAWQTLSPASYALDDYGSVHWLLPAAGSAWPDTYEAANVVKVRYVAGTQSPPPTARAAILLLVGHLYENRQEVADARLQRLPLGARSLLDSLKVWRF